MEAFMRRLCLLVLVLVVVACTPAPVQPIGPAPTPTIAPALVPAATAKPSATAGPTIDLSPPMDLAPYRAAMKPEFAAEVDRFGNAPQYQIDLTIAPDLKSYAATQVVTYTNVETVPLSEIYFSLFANLDSYGGQLQVDTLHVNGQAVKPVYEEDNSALKVALAQPLSPGRSVVLDLTYTGEVPTSDVKLGYNQFGLHDNVLALPNFYPQIPAYDQRGWNIDRGPGYGDAVFSDTALYRVNVTAPADQVVATSGVCDRAGHETTTVYHCVSGPMRDFMIAMSADYQVKSDTVDGVKLNSYYREELADEGERGLQVVADALRTYEKRIGEYPFNELDLVGTPTTAGGIEYPGLIVVAEGLYERNPTFYESATAHETAHQWWYSLVGDDQIHDPWLDEALTQFTTALYFRDQYGAAGMQSYVEQALQRGYDRVKGTAEDKRADLPVSAYDEGQYGAIVYEKAPLFFNAIYDEIGDEKFNQLLQDYFKQYRYGVAYLQDFLKVAEDYVGKAKLDELVKEWITTP
jgi:aminopeptidase N